MTIDETKDATTGRPVAHGDHVYLIDGSGYIFRAYHALPPLKMTGLRAFAMSAG